jgi:hypothetical protein
LSVSVGSLVVSDLLTGLGQNGELFQAQPTLLYTTHSPFAFVSKKEKEKKKLALAFLSSLFRSLTISDL